MSEAEAFEEMGRAIAAQLTTPLDEHVDSAEQKLDDDDLVAFGLVAVRDGDGGLQGASQRVIDPERVRESNRDPEAVIGDLHDALCQVWDTEVADR